MEYFTRYGLEFNPFLKNSKEILVDTNERRETLFRLDYLAKTKGFGLLTVVPDAVRQPSSAHGRQDSTLLFTR